MSKPYWHCSTCGGNFDHGEKCDCLPKEPKLKVSDSLMLGVDLSGGKDISVIQVFRREGNAYNLVSTISGEEADKTYDILTNRGSVINI